MRNLIVIAAVATLLICFATEKTHATGYQVQQFVVQQDAGQCHGLAAANAAFFVPRRAAPVRFVEVPVRQAAPVYAPLGVSRSITVERFRVRGRIR